MNLKILEVTTKGVKAERKVSTQVGTGSAPVSFTVGQLSERERMRRAARMGRPVFELYRGLLALRSRRPTTALEHFKASDSELSRAIADQMENGKKDRMEAAAEATWKKLREAGESITGKTQALKVKALLDAFQTNYGKTDFAAGVQTEIKPIQEQLGWAMHNMRPPADGSLGGGTSSTNRLVIKNRVEAGPPHRGPSRIPSGTHVEIVGPDGQVWVNNKHVQTLGNVTTFGEGNHIRLRIAGSAVNITGIVRPGGVNAVGRLRMEGTGPDTVATFKGVIEIEVESRERADQVASAAPSHLPRGALSVAGCTIYVRPIGGFEASEGDTFVIFPRFTKLTGTPTIDAPPGQTWSYSTVTNAKGAVEGVLTVDKTGKADRSNGLVGRDGESVP